MGAAVEESQVVGFRCSLRLAPSVLRDQSVQGDTYA